MDNRQPHIGSRTGNVIFGGNLPRSPALDLHLSAFKLNGLTGEYIYGAEAVDGFREMSGKGGKASVIARRKATGRIK